MVKKAKQLQLERSEWCDNNKIGNGQTKKTFVRALSNICMKTLDNGDDDDVLPFWLNDNDGELEEYMQQKQLLRTRNILKTVNNICLYLLSESKLQQRKAIL